MPIHSIYFKNNGLLCGQFKEISWIGLENESTRSSVYSINASRTCTSLSLHKDNILSTFRERPPKTEFLSLTFKHEDGVRVATSSVVNQFVVGHQHDKITKVSCEKIWSLV